MKKKQGISLIVLVITIIVIVILAVSVILSIANNNPIENAKESRFKNDVKTMQEELELYISAQYLNTSGTYDRTELYADESSLIENGAKLEGKTIKDIIPSISNKYLNTFQVETGKLKYTSENDMNELSWADEILEGKTNIKYNQKEVFANSSITLENYNTLKKMKIYGNSVQNGEPTPENPVEVESVGDKTKNVAVIKKYAGLKEENGVYSTNVLDDATTLAMKIQFKLEGDSGITYVAQKVDTASPGRYSITIVAPDEEWEHFRLANRGQTREFSIYFDLPYEQYKGKTITVSFTIVDSNVATCSLKDIQIEEGDTATEYEPYGKYKIPITVSDGSTSKTSAIYLDEPLRKVGDYADYIDLESSKVVRQVKETTINSLGFMESSAINGYHRYETGTMSDKLFTESLSMNVLSNVLRTTTYKEKADNSISERQNYNFLRILSSEYSTLRELQDAIGEGKVYYVLETPIEETIDVSDILIQESVNTVAIDIGTSVAPSKINVIYNQK